MSAHVTLLKLPRRITSVAELDQVQPLVMGTVAEIHAALEAWLPGIVWEQPWSGRGRDGVSWWRIFLDPPSAPTSVGLELSLGAEAWEAIGRLCRATGWTAVDAGGLRMVG